MRKLLNKKGSITIFLTSILITMIMVSMVFVHAARSICGASYSDAVLELAGRSVLSEFDRRLKNEYGIFAFYMLEDRLRSEIKFYASESFKKSFPGEFPGNDKEIIDMFRLKLQSIRASLADYSLMDVGVLESQIEDYMDFMIAEKGIEFIRNLLKSGDSGEGQGEKNDADRQLKNKAEIAGLPSYGNASNGINIAAIVDNGIPSLGTIFDEGSKLFKVNEYILSHFKYNVGGNKMRNTFFKNEVEYILYGKLNDKDNARRFKIDFIILRTLLNAAHIYADQVKREEALLAAEAIAPGPGAAVAMQVIVAAWSEAEAENDYKLLMAGKKVALIKSEPTWALDMKTVLTGKSINGYVTPQSETGISYADYLRLFLYLEKRETKLLRVMDLIQINLRGSYYSDFLIKDHYTGFSFEAQVSGKKFEYEQKY